MSYNNLKILLHAAQEAFKEGKLTSEKYSSILDDIETEIIDVDKVILEEDVRKIILQYSTI